MKAMNEYEMQVYIEEALLYYYETTLEIKRIRSYMEANLLSKQMGLVITLQDGSEFQVTVVKTKLAERAE